jgi:hypothetical protein
MMMAIGISQSRRMRQRAIQKNQRRSFMSESATGAGFGGSGTGTDAVNIVVVPKAGVTV